MVNGKRLNLLNKKENLVKISTTKLRTMLPQLGNYTSLLLYGPDSGLADMVVKSVSKYQNKDITTLYAPDILSDASHLYDALFSPSLLGDTPLIVIRDAGDKFTKFWKELLAENKPFETFVIIVAGELAAKSSLRKLFEKEKNLIATACYHDDTGQINALICRTLKGIDYDRDVTKYLEENLGNDRMVSMNELEKLKLYAESTGKLTLEDVILVTGGNAEAGFNDLNNAVLSGDIKGLEKWFDMLTKEGESIIAILRIISKYVEKLIFIKGKIENGENMDTAMRSLRPPLFFKQIPITKQHIMKHNLTSLTSAYKKLSDAELSIKSGIQPDTIIARQALLEISSNA